MRFKCLLKEEWKQKELVLKLKYERQFPEKVLPFGRIWIATVHFFRRIPLISMKNSGQFQSMNL